MTTHNPVGIGRSDTNQCSAMRYANGPQGSRHYDCCWEMFARQFRAESIDAKERL
jgi:hypothetical protein